jgi:integrase/ribosome-binding protein aMBF1 (putative translation factor)
MIKNEKEMIYKLEQYLSKTSFLPESKNKRLLIDYEIIAMEIGIDLDVIKKKKFKSMIDNASKTIPIEPIQNINIQTLTVNQFYNICEDVIQKEKLNDKLILTVLKKLIRAYELDSSSDASLIFYNNECEYIYNVNTAFASHTETTKNKYISAAKNLKKYYDGAIYSLKNLPEDFSEAIAQVHEQSGLSISQAEHKAGLKRNSARHIITGKHTPSYKQIDNIVKLEKAYCIPKYSLVSKLKINNNWHKIDKKLIPEEFRKKTNLWSKLLANLTVDFNTTTNEKRYEICEWIYNNIVVSNTVYSKRLRKNLGQKYKFIELDKACLLKNQIDRLVSHKESKFPDFCLKKYGTWAEATSEIFTDCILYYLGYLRNINTLTSDLPIEDYSLLLLLSDKLIHNYIKWQIDRRQMFSFGDFNLLDLIISFCNEETGFLYQQNLINTASKNLIDILNLKNSEELEVDNPETWTTLCTKQKKFCINFRNELKKSYQKNQVDSNGNLILSRDSFEPINAILDYDEPWTEYFKLLKVCRENYSMSKTQPKLNFSFLGSYLSAMFILQTGLRSKNIRLLKFTDGLDKDKGQLYYVNSKYYIDIPWHEVKNKRHVLREIIDCNNLYSDIRAYLSLKKEIFYKNTNNNFIVTIDNNIYSKNTFHHDFKEFTKIYICYNKFKNQYMVENLQPHSPHHLRHIIATHVLKQTKSFADAALAIHDSEKVTRDCYARFLPKDECQTFKTFSQNVFT